MNFTTIKRVLMMTLFLAPAAGLVAPQALAQDNLAAGAFEHRIAVVDVPRAVMNTDYAIAKMEEANEKTDIRENLDTLKALEDELKAMIENYQKEQDIMSNEKRAEEQRRLKDKQADHQHLLKKLVDARKEIEKQIFDEVGESARAALQGIVDDENITLLMRLEVGNILHWDDTYDVTTKLTERLNLANQ